MKRKITLALMGVALLCALATGANADLVQITNNTAVQSWQATQVYGYDQNGYVSGPTDPKANINPPDNTWHDYIGTTTPFKTTSATYDTDSGKLTIHTNWQGADGSDLGATAADVFLKINFTNSSPWDLAVGVGNGRLDNVYSGSSYTTSQDWGNQSGNTSLIYGGMYATLTNQTDPQVIPVLATGASTSESVVTWTPAGSGYDLSIDLKALNGGFVPVNFAFLWGTGTCGNGTFEGDNFSGNVPLPGSLLLLGTGLAGLGLVGRRRKLT